MIMIRSLMLAAGLALLTISSVQAASRSYDTSSFSEVSVSSGISAIIEVGKPQAISAEATTDALLDRLDVHVRDNKLEVGFKWDVLDWLFTFGQTRTVTLHISAPQLSAVESSAGANVDARAVNGSNLRFGVSSGASLSADTIRAEHLTLDSSSGGNLTISGTCDKLIANSSSGGNIAAQALDCADVNANASSGGHADVSAMQSINANASSGGGITIQGKPTQTTINSSSGGSAAFAN
jgi:hypothetical protein